LGLVVAGCAVGWCTVVSVTVNTLAHLQWFNLLNLSHSGYVTVACGTHTGRSFLNSARRVANLVLVCSQITNVWLVNEPNVVWQSVNSSPVDWLGPVIANNVSGISQDCQLGVTISTDHLVTCSTEVHGWNSSVCLGGNCPVAESTVESQSFHGLTVSSNVSQLLGRSMDGVREVNWLLERLLEAENWYWLADPTCNHECGDYTKNGNHTEPANGQHGHKQFRH
jgi:hypothetical protein